MLQGKTALVTGSTSGIGLGIAEKFASLGANIVLNGLGRLDDIEAARSRLESTHRVKVRYDPADMTDAPAIEAMIRKAQAEFGAIDVLVNNAGVNDTESSLTVDGFDHMMASNYLGPFLLTRLVLDRVKAAAPSRIVVVGSEAHRMAGPFDPERFEDLGRYGPVNNNLAYGRTKLLDQLFTNELARRLEGTGVTANSVCPGLVATNLVDMGPLRPIMQAAARTPFVNTPAEGARLVVRLATDPKLEGVTGRFYTTTPGMRLLPPVPAMLDTRLQRRIWERTEALVGLTPAG